MKTDWREKPASEIRDHDEIHGHGYVDWTVGYPHDQIAVHVHSGTPDRGSYTILFPSKAIVSYRR